MIARRIFAGVATLLWVGGCASILGVDADEYVDAADVLCRCASDLDRCKGQVEGAIEDDESGKLETATIECLGTEGDACGEVYKCIAASYCSELAKRCALDNKGEPVVACCGELECGVNEKCCAKADAACDPLARAENAGCCAGLTCTDGICVGGDDGCPQAGDPCGEGGVCCAELNCADFGSCVKNDCLGVAKRCNQPEDCCSLKCEGAGGVTFCAVRN